MKYIEEYYYGCFQIDTFWTFEKNSKKFDSQNKAKV